VKKTRSIGKPAGITPKDGSSEHANFLSFMKVTDRDGHASPLVYESVFRDCEIIILITRVRSVSQMESRTDGHFFVEGF